MLLSLMIYASVVTALAAGAAWALERALRGRGLPTRWVWVAAIAAGVFAVAAGVPFDGIRAVSGSVPSPAIGTVVAPGADLPTEPAGPVAIDTSDGLVVTARYDPILAGVWLLLSLAMLAGMTRGYAVLRRERADWEPDAIDGVPVLVSEARGPAVVGVGHPDIVVPRWFTRLEGPDRRLLLDHEREHVEAGDSRMLASALLVLALLPWNPALWWIVARLRQALEIDCDRRVLRGSPGVRRYASLLIDMGARVGRPRFALLAFAAPALFLERRIRAMTDYQKQNPFRTALFALVGAALIGGACYVEQVQVHIDDDETLPDVTVEGVDIAPAAVAGALGSERLADTESPFVVTFEYDGKQLAGSVIDRETGQPIGQAQVFFPELAMGGLTRADGRFLLLNVPPGTHELQVKHIAHGEAMSTMVIPEIADQARSEQIREEFMPWMERELVTLRASYQQLLHERARGDFEEGPADQRILETLARLEAMVRAEGFVSEQDRARMQEMMARVDASIRSRADRDRLPPPPVESDDADAPTSAIVGTVRDADGDPIAGAQVYIDEISIGALTNTQGRFLLLRVPVGEHVLTIERTGFESSEMRVEVVAGGPVGKSVVARLRPIDP